MTANRTAFTPEEQAAFAPAEKIGIVACSDAEGRPHVTLITSIMAPRPDRLTLGEFCRGLSKAYIQQNPRIAFLIMTMDRRFWRGWARWTHLRREGPEYQRYNDLPMFRYNSYFGINTVHYLDLIATEEPSRLPMARVVLGALLTRLGKAAAATGESRRILKPFADAAARRILLLEELSRRRSQERLEEHRRNKLPQLMEYRQKKAEEARRRKAELAGAVSSPEDAP